MSEKKDAPEHKLWLDVRYLDDHLLLTPTEVWTFLTVPGINTSMPTQQQINEIIRSVETVLDGLGNPDVELHYHLAYRDMDLFDWAANLRAGATAPTPAWEDYLDRMRQRMTGRGFRDRVLFLGVRLGSRTGLVKPNTRGATPTQWFKAWLNAALAVAAGPDLQPSAEEVARWREVAAKTRAALASSVLRMQGASANDVAWLIRHVQRLGMPEGPKDMVGRTWGAGQVVSLAEAVTDNTDPSQLTLRLTGRNATLPAEMTVADRDQGAFGFTPQAANVSHVAILPIGKIPDLMSSPWLFHASAMDFPVEVSARIRLLTPDQAEKDAAKAARLQRNAITDAMDGGNAVHNKDARRYSGAAALHQEQAAGDAPRQIIATYRLIVAADTRERVGAYAEEVIRHFREDNALGVTVEWPPGDQLMLWQELLPGQRTRTKLYEQRQDLVTFAVGLPFSVTTAGDGEGPYIGEVLTGAPTPVLYDMATAAKRGKAPTLALTGTLGGGKTFLLLTLMDHFRLRGYPVIALDPKGDIKGHLLLHGRGDARFFDLSTDGQPGSLDPFTLVPAGVDPNDPDRCTPELADARWREETRALVLDVLEQLLPSGDPRERTVVAMTLNEEMAQPYPTMAHFLEMLRRGGARPAQEAGVSDSTVSEYAMAAVGAHAQLSNASETQLGRLMFAPRTTSGASLFQGGVSTTIVSLSGLDLPQDGRGATSPTQRISVALFSLVAHQARRMLQDLDYVGPRALIIDEAHQITCLPSGRALIVSNGRMGRSRDIAMLLATQSAADLNGTDLRNVISAVFAFRTKEREEREDIAQLLGRNRDDEAIHAMLPGDTSPAGRCLFSWEDNVALVQVDRWAKEYKAFNTNPDRQNVSAAGTRIVSDQFGVVRDPDGPASGVWNAARDVAAAPARPALEPAVTTQVGVDATEPTQPTAPAYTAPAQAPVQAPVYRPVPVPAPTRAPVQVPSNPPVPVGDLAAAAPTTSTGWWDD